MTKIERLKLRFASGMSEGRISSDEWEIEFLPILEDAERYRYVATLGALPTRTVAGYHYSDGIFHKTVNEAIDAARTPTKEQQ